VGVAVASYGLGDGVGGAAPSGEHYDRRALRPASAAEAGGDIAVCDLPTVHQHGDRGSARSSGNLVEGQLSAAETRVSVHAPPILPLPVAPPGKKH
jgi:hypothetical protein